MNRSKRERLRRGAKPEFGLVSVAIGAFTGMGAGFAVELFTRGGMVFMQIGGVLGAVVGMIVQAVSFWRRQHKYRKARNP